MVGNDFCVKKLENFEGLVLCEECNTWVLAKESIMVSEYEKEPKILCIKCLLYFVGEFLGRMEISIERFHQIESI